MTLNKADVLSLVAQRAALIKINVKKTLFIR